MEVVAVVVVAVVAVDGGGGEGSGGGGGRVDSLPPDALCKVSTRPTPPYANEVERGDWVQRISLLLLDSEVNNNSRVKPGKNNKRQEKQQQKDCYVRYEQTGRQTEGSKWEVKNRKKKKGRYTEAYIQKGYRESKWTVKRLEGKGEREG